MVRTCRKAPGRILAALAWLIAIGMALPSFARIPSQLNFRAWTAPEGAPDEFTEIAQTPDGILWLGGSSGLVRFDGIRFVDYPQAGDARLPSNDISSLIASPDGALWIGFRFGGVSELRRGSLTNYTATDGLPEGTVAHFAWGPDGCLWAAMSSGLMRFDSKRWERVAPEAISFAKSVLFDPKGNLWIATWDRVLVRASHQRDFQEVAQLTDATVGGQPFAVARDQSVWIWTRDGLTRMTTLPDGTVSKSHINISGANVPLFIDHDDRLWLGGDTARLVTPPLPVDDSTPTLPESLPGEPGRSFFEDRERNVWAAVNHGIARFSRSNVVNAPALHECGTWGYALAARLHPSTVWISCANPAQDRGVTEIRDDSHVISRDMPTFTASYTAPDGVVWFAGAHAISRIDVDDTLSTRDRPTEAGDFDTQAIARDLHGDLWISIAHRGVFRYSGGVWTRNGGLKSLPDTPTITMSVDLHGGLWLGYTHSRIFRVAGNNVRAYGPADGLSIGNITALGFHGDRVWVGGELGLELFDGKRFYPVDATSGDPFTGITAILETETADMWLNGDQGITFIPHADIERTLQLPGDRVSFRTFNALDGVGRAQALRPIPSAVRDGNGRLWFQPQSKGSVWLDPNRLTHNLLPPPVTIWSIISNGVRYPHKASSITLPIHTTQLEFEYTAGSLTVPERVRFRYELDGVDRDWQDAGGRREAFYTNLAPGQYTFRVIAANDDGVWNTRGASVNFVIPPAFYQTAWFHLLCILGVLGVLALLYQLRIRQMSARALARLQERLTERDRIARELHDTLLQGVQGLILRFQAITDSIPSREPAREAMEKTLERADSLLRQSRARVKDLRDSAAARVSLPEALAAEAEQMALVFPTQFKVTVDAEPQPLHPIVREEVLLIAREALLNAFQHAHAASIEVDVYYEVAELIVRIRDSGCGIDPEVLRHGLSQHYGLLGMRERAGKLRGSLDIWSTPGGGTEVDLRVPASVAYSKPWRKVRWPRRKAWVFEESP